MTFTERQLREKNYYEQYASLFDFNQEIDFSPVEGPLSGRETRPWNSYWRTYEIPVNLIKQKQQTLSLLDFGCGPGENALRFARAGFHVTGFDICEKNIYFCQKLFERNGFLDKGDFSVSAAEILPYADESFDVIVGIDILHHVDIPKAMNEIHRVLKKEGIAIFREPIEAPFFEKIRNSKLVTFFFPKTPSLEAHITQDERKLNKDDLKTITKTFPECHIERQLILSRFDKLIRRSKDKTYSFLELADYYLNKIIPFWGALGGSVVLTLKK